MPDFLRADRKRQATAAAVGIALVVLIIVAVATQGFGLASESPSPSSPPPPPPSTPPSKPTRQMSSHHGAAAISAVACKPGNHFLCQGSCKKGTSPGLCESCPPGRADLDFNSRTQCHVCPAGKYAPGGTTQCYDCKDQHDSVDDPATPCSVQHICTQKCKFYTSHVCQHTYAAPPCMAMHCCIAYEVEQN